MNSYFWIFILFTLTIFQSTGCVIDYKTNQNSKSLELFYKNLRALDLEKAKESLGDNTTELDNLAFLLISLLNHEKVEVAFTEVPLKNQKVEVQLLKNLILGYNAINEDDNAIIAYQNFSRAISLADKNNLPNALKFSLISILDLLRKQSFFGEDKFSNYLDHYKELTLDDTDRKILLIYELGVKSNETDEMESRFQGFEKVITLDSFFNMGMNNEALKANYFFETAIQFKLAKDYAEAIKRLHKAFYYSKKYDGNKYVEEASTWHLSTLHLLNGNKDSAFIKWRQATRMSDKLNNRWYNQRLASWLFADSKLYDSAYYYLNESINTGFQIDGREERIQSTLFSIENQTDKLKLDKLRLDNKRKTNLNFLIVAISFLIIGGVTSILLQKNTTKKRQLAEQEAVLKQQRVDNLLKEQELVSIDAMIAGQEKERQKVAGELHDDLGSLMATIKLHFDNVEVDKKDPALQNAQKLLEEAYQKIRGMAHSKNSGVMSDQGLLAAIRKMAKTITDTNAMEVTVEDFGLGERMENSLELSIFRIVQELVANAIKHAEASKVNIQLTQHEDNLNIIVEDNGKGFDWSKLNTTKSGMGLTTIEKRVEHLEGSFTVDSVLGKGTSILIDIPV